MSNTVMECSKVFVIYSHTDSDWLKRLQIHLKELERRGLVELWDDTKIRAGGEWPKEIGVALSSAAAAVLLISADFIASDFIADEELPPLLAAAEKQGVVILPLILSPSRFEKIKSLSRFQSVNPPSKPLIDLSKGEQERYLVKVTDDVLNAITKAEKRYAKPAQVPYQQMTISPDKVGEQAPDQENHSTELKREEVYVSLRLSRWRIDYIRTILLSHKRLIVSLGLILAAISVAAYHIISPNLLGRPETSVTLPKFQLTDTEAKDTYNPIPNIAFLRYRQDFGDVDILDESGNRRLIWTGEGVSRNRNAVNQIFKELKKSGVSAVVWFLFADGAASPDFDKDGYVTGLDQSFVNDYKAAIELAEKNDLSIIWVLIDNQWMKPKETQKDGAILYGHADVIDDPKKQAAFFEKALKPLLQMYPTQGPIAGWILVNEPEVALEQGYVLEKNLDGFIHKAAQIIREIAPNQPVSLGHLDLESLIKYHRDHTNIEFDFYVFHHYKIYMPPSVAQIKGLMGDTSNKPIYIGEFSLNEPTRPRPVDWDRFVNWSRTLGYAGVWPWALKPIEKEPEKYQDIANISRLIEEVRQQPRIFDDIERSVWQAHAERGVEIVDQEVKRWRDEILVEHSNQIAINKKECDRTLKQLALEQFKRANEEQTLAQANQRHAQNLRALTKCQDDLKKPGHSSDVQKQLMSNELNLKNSIYAPGGSEEWVNSATHNLEKTKLEIRKQEGWLLDYERKIRLNEYQSKMKELRIQLAQPLYLNYWKEEIRKISSAGNR